MTVSGTGSSLTITIISDLSAEGKMYVDLDASGSFTTGDRLFDNPTKIRFQANSNCTTLYDDGGEETVADGSYPSEWLTMNGSTKTIAICSGPFTDQSITVQIQVSTSTTQPDGNYEQEFTYTLSDS